MIKNLFKSDSQIVAEIHREIDTAEDRLLREANDVLKASEPQEAEELYNRLHKVGFTSTPAARIAREVISISEQAKEEAELVQYYKQTYPFLKFLTVEELDRICGKYKLIYAEVSRYIKDIPEKNLLEIERAQPLKREDRYNAKELMMYEDALRGIREGLTVRWFLSAPERRDGLYIAAPKSHFDLKGLKKRGFGWFAPKDPIVFRYVRGGIQVLTKWGLEANDPSLINSIDN